MAEKLIEMVKRSRFMAIKRVIGVGSSKAEKARLAAEMGREMVVRGGLDKGLAGYLAAEELTHAVNYSRRCKFGYRRGFFGLGGVVSAHCDYLDEPTDEEVFFGSLAGMNKWVMVGDGEGRYRHYLYSKHDVAEAVEVGGKLSVGERLRVLTRIFK